MAAPNLFQVIWVLMVPQTSLSIDLVARGTRFLCCSQIEMGVGEIPIPPLPVGPISLGLSPFLETLMPMAPQTSLSIDLVARGTRFLCCSQIEMGVGKIPIPPLPVGPISLGSSLSVNHCRTEKRAGCLPTFGVGRPGGPMGWGSTRRRRVSIMK
jgi:hypothetical protein